jgi:hypothetical protein
LEELEIVVFHLLLAEEEDNAEGTTEIAVEEVAEDCLLASLLLAGFVPFGA